MTNREIDMAEKKKQRRTISVYVDPSTDIKLKEMASSQGSSITKMVEGIVTESITKSEDRDKSLPSILVFSNFKGGVSKTTSVREVAYNLSTRGYKVLVIDLDGQSNLSASFQCYDARNLPGYITDVILADVTGTRKTLSEVITPTEYENLDLAPANLTFAAADNKIRSQEGGAIDKRLYYAIDDLIKESDYDYILIDCPPTADAVVSNAVLALSAGSSKSMVIIPVNADVQAIDGLSRTIELVDTITNDNRIPQPRIMVLWTQIAERTNLFKTLHEEFREEFPLLTEFETVITTSTKVGEARAMRQPLQVYNSKTSPAERYRNLTKEILKITQR